MMKPFLLLLLIVIFCLNLQLTASEFDEQIFFNIYEEYRNVPENLMLMKHSHVIDEIFRIGKLNSQIGVEKIGESVEHRSINLVSFGKGPVKILLWSQMHGDEPTATAALLGIYNYFAQKFNEEFIQELYNNLTIHSIIMLNPDGAERFQRRNVLDIDINRDARLLQTPEGRILKKMQEKIKPHFGFNLHDMGGRETVEGTGNILKIALMAPPFDKENNDNSTRIKAKQLAVNLKHTLEKFIKGHIAKYKADYMPRAFGDAMQNWGVSTVLLETGRYTGDSLHYLEKLNFVALLSAFNTIAERKLNNYDAEDYKDIPLEGRKLYDVLLRNVLIFNGFRNNPFYGDLGINVDFKLKKGQIDTIGFIREIGDLSIYNGKNIIQEPDLIVVPGFIITENQYHTDINKLFKCAFTTIVKSDNKINLKHFISDLKIPISKLPNLTSLPAQKYKLFKKGNIKRNALADILVFSQKDKTILDLNNLKYVFKNGILHKI